MTPSEFQEPDKAAEFRLLGLLFERPTEDTRRQVREMGRETKNPELRAIAGRLEAADEATHVAMFGPGGPVSPREVAYRGREDLGRIMSEIAAFYQAFGYHPVTEEPIDHVAVEAGFMGYLWVKEIYASGREAEAAITAAARTRFMEDHLSTLASGIEAKLRTLQAPDHLDAARALLERVGGAALPEGPGSDPDDEEEVTCGPCPVGS